MCSFFHFGVNPHAPSIEKIKTVYSYFSSNQTWIQNRISFSCLLNQLVLAKMACGPLCTSPPPPKLVDCSYMCEVAATNINAPFRNINLKIMSRVREVS